MKRRCRVPLLVAFAFAASVPATAAELPPIKAGEHNRVPACATPASLTAYIRSRNTAIESRFDGLAANYKSHGEELGIRWDYAFFQMMKETANLSFPRNVKSDRNNFAGLGATGGDPGESFADVSSGVKAHLQHLLMYAGTSIDSPVAERTRKVQSWGILTSWQKSIKGPITFADLASKWAPNDLTYASEIATIASEFQTEFCGQADPKPESAAGKGAEAPAKAAAADAPAKAAAADAPKKGGGDTGRSALGAPAATGAAKGDNAAGKSAADKSAAAAGAAAKAMPPPAKAAPPPAKGAMRCRVWTASYGGTKAVIIKAVADQYINYTVLDVHEGSEKREMEAYIAAYARGGEQIGVFATQSQALDKAFELCPEG